MSPWKFMTQDTIAPSRFLIVRKTTATIQTYRALSMGGDCSKSMKVSIYILHILQRHKRHLGYSICTMKFASSCVQKTGTEHLTVTQHCGNRDVLLKFENGDKAADARRYHQGRELLKSEFGTEDEFISMKDQRNEVNPDGMPLHATPHLSQNQASEPTPSTATQTLESLIPKGQPLRLFRGDSGNFAMIRQRLPDESYKVLEISSLQALSTT
jgi:hypothetical protein